jgi:hypothetical protein
MAQNGPGPIPANSTILRLASGPTFALLPRTHLPTFRTEIWRDGALASFRTRAIERNVVAISNGRAELG